MRIVLIPTKGTQVTKKAVALFRLLMVLPNQALPNHLDANFALAYGLQIAHMFSTCLEIGLLKGEEKRNKGHKGEYIVQLSPVS